MEMELKYPRSPMSPAASKIEKILSSLTIERRRARYEEKEEGDMREKVFSRRENR